MIIEVSDSSLDYDTGKKAELFAAAGVADYWVVNIPERRVEVFRRPDGKRYADRQVFRAPEEIRPLAFPKVVLPVELLFPGNS